MNNRTYAILPSTDLDNVDFGAVLQGTPSRLRYSVAQDKFVVKWTGDTPAFMASCTPSQYEGRSEHNHTQILEIMATTEWTTPIE
jgi:uncharacterized protein (UPF0261 family)